MPRNIDGGVTFSSQVGFATEIEAKYHDTIYKISRTATKHFLDNFVRSAIRDYFS